MSDRIDPRAGHPAALDNLVDVSRLVTAYYTGKPDPAVAAQRVAFGTSGHRGSSFDLSFNEAHVLAISQAICDYRKDQEINGPLYIGCDTHALSAPAFATALEVLAANGVEVMRSTHDEYTPTPAVSHAILVYNRGRASGMADGIVITPSHNPPDSGGFKYNTPDGGPADTRVTGWMEQRANQLLESELRYVKRMPFAAAAGAASTHWHDYVSEYVDDLRNVLDLPAIQASTIRLGVDPLGGAGVHYWQRIADQYKLNLTVVSEEVDSTFRFMTLDWDGKIRMDPSSRYAMQRLIGLKDKYDIAFACDTDHDRHGIVAPSVGLMPPNHYLSVAIDYLFRNRGGWKSDAGVGKTIVSSAMIDRVAKRLNRKLYEVPVGFKWFVPGLSDGSLGFGGEESAGASFNRHDGSAWSTDKDGICAALLSAEITAKLGHDPGIAYRQMTAELGEPVADRVEARATPAQKKKLAKLDRSQIKSSNLAGEKISDILTTAPANGAPIGGVKVIAPSGWFAARPSGTEDIYKIYAESFQDGVHLQQILNEAQKIVDAALAD